MSLSNEQVEFIRMEIDKSAVSMEDLKEDLLDHFCCFVEDRMEKGDEFEMALAEARRQICPNGPEEIQREIFYLLNLNKLLTMKAIMYLIGLLSSIALCTGFLFRLMYWPGANPLMIIGNVGLLLIFIPMLVLLQLKIKKEAVVSEKIKLGLGFMSSIIVGFAVGFKQLHWAGANILLVVGFAIFILGFLPVMFFRMYKKAVAQ